jgi:FtsP/CotA-like multicopper oxidase with cupredoxin domain
VSLGVIQHTPSSSFEAVRGVPVYVKWVNDLTGSILFPVDPTLHWADPNNLMLNGTGPFEPYPPGYPEAQSPVPMVPHLHGGEDPSTSDGGPQQWWTSTGLHGEDYATLEPTDLNAAVYHYPNEQPPGTLWYHDHALGLTRINVFSGLAGYYFLRDPADQVALLLPSGKYEVPLAIQDRAFNVDGSLWFPSQGVNPDIHPYWSPEYFGNTIMVNGAVWPNLDVNRGQYRFRVLDASNARFYHLYFTNHMRFTVIGTDDSYLRKPATISDLLIAPGERYDILVDFSTLQPGTEVILYNDALAPFGELGGEPADPETVGQIMKFTVTTSDGFSPKQLPEYLNPTLPANQPFPTLIADAPMRTLVMNEVLTPNGPVVGMLDGQRWSGAVSELPIEGTTEDWAIINLTEDSHTIHIHLAQFQLVSRQTLDEVAYITDWEALNGSPPLSKPTISLPFESYVKDVAFGAKPLEQTWKDTIIVYPGMVNVIRIRFAPVDGSPEYSFDPTAGQGYVWHCHILDHEDNEMMRPIMVVAPKQTTTITCTPSASSILRGSSITASGVITPAVAGAAVTLTYRGGTSNITRSATTGPDGGFSDTYTPTMAASWSVMASWIGNNAYVGSASSPAQFNVTEPTIKGSIKITVRDSSGTPVQGASVSSTSTPSGQATLTGTTGSDGVVTFNDVAPGAYTMQASKSGYVAQTVTATVAVGETQQQSVMLQMESTGVPGYPFESVVVGLLVVVAALLLLGKRR